jgi:hypothetical protein
MAVQPGGGVKITKWRTLGRVSHETAVVMPDNRTVYTTDDATNGGAAAAAGAVAAAGARGRLRGGGPGAQRRLLLRIEPRAAGAPAEQASSALPSRANPPAHPPHSLPSSPSPQCCSSLWQTSPQTYRWARCTRRASRGSTRTTRGGPRGACRGSPWAAVRREGTGPAGRGPELRGPASKPAAGGRARPRRANPTLAV